MPNKISLIGLTGVMAVAMSYAPAVMAQAAAEPAAAAAAEPAAASPFSANVTLTSQYVSRGFRQTWGQPAVQGGVDYAHPSGAFAGTWMSSVSSKFIEGASVEWDVYAGYGGTVGDIAYSGQLNYYAYPGAKNSAANVSPNYGEAVASATYKWINVKYWLTYTPDYFGYNSTTLGGGQDLHSRGSGYLDVNGTFDLGNGVSLLVHGGHQRIKNFSGANFRDARIAISKVTDDKWTVTGAYTKGWGKEGYYDNYKTGATDSKGKEAISNPLAGTLLVSLSRTF